MFGSSGGDDGGRQQRWRHWRAVAVMQESTARAPPTQAKIASETPFIVVGCVLSLTVFPEVGDERMWMMMDEGVRLFPIIVEARRAGEKGGSGGGLAVVVGKEVGGVGDGCNVIMLVLKVVVASPPRGE